MPAIHHVVTSHRSSRHLPPPIATHDAVGPLELIGATMAYGRNEEIFGEGEPAEYLYKVVRGVVRMFKILDDGRRQVSGFYLPGDFFGIEFTNDHSSSCEAICAVTVLVMKQSALTDLAKRDAAVSRQLWDITARELARAQEHVVLLIRSAEERVRAFLAEMAVRTRSSQEIELPMSRQDIADHLGLTIETVSRTMTQLEKDGVIAIPTSRHILVRRRSSLDAARG